MRLVRTPRPRRGQGGGCRDRAGFGRDDERPWDDPAYATALDTYGGLRAARERIEGVLAALAAQKEG